SEAAALETGCVFAGANTFAAGFNADHPHRCVVEERMKEPDGVAAAADAGDENVRQFSFAFLNLLARFEPDDAMKIADHHRIGMGAKGGAEDVVRTANVCHPVAHRFV